jgi:hypothetical protein
MRKINISLSVILAVNLIFGVAGELSAQKKVYSAIWGKDGEVWDKSRIPDFTDAGYKKGRTAIPDFVVGVNVNDFGAKGDAVTDNTEAFRKAIKACKKNTALFIPAGIYMIADTICIAKSGIVIKGAGNNKTTILIKKGLEQLYPKYNVSGFKNQTPWSWGGAMLLFKGNIADVGIENLSIRFPDSLYAGHNFHERAYNAIGFSDKAHDGWIRNVNIIGADVGIWIERSANHITAENWKLQMGPARAAQSLSGHHGVNIYGGHNLFQAFEVQAIYQHDLSVEGDSSIYNVFHNGKGKDLCIDHHNHAQYNNLFTNIDAGVGSRIYHSGGVEGPLGISHNETFWNIYALKPMEYSDQFNSKVGRSHNDVMVGITTNRPSELGINDGNWFETINPHNLYPSDLYLAQLKYHHYN